MELDLNFGDDDFSEDVADKADRTCTEPTYIPKQCAPKWFEEVKPEIPEETQQQQLLWKHRGDLAYATGDFTRALEAYGSCLETVAAGRSAGIRRDATEAMARCCLKLERLDDAEQWAIKLHSTSHSNNVDHLTISRRLLAEVSRALGRTLAELSNLSAVASIHPFAPDPWMSLADAYDRLREEEAVHLPVSGGRHKLREEAAAFCLVRANVLLRTVDKTVRSFARAANKRQEEEIKERLKEKRLSAEEADRMELFASMDVFGRREGEEVGRGREFEDLGKSARQRAIEESYREEAEGTGSEDEVEIVSKFEKEWLLFLVE